MTKKNDCDRACKTCPFLTANHGKPNPEGVEILRAENGEGLTDWYSEENLRRLWMNGLRHGEGMICHSTDPTASSYGGKDARKGVQKPCTGSLIAVFKHIKYLETILKENKHSAQKAKRIYFEKTRKEGLSDQGIQNWIHDIGIGWITNRLGMPVLKLPFSFAGE